MQISQENNKNVEIKPLLQFLSFLMLFVLSALQIYISRTAAAFSSIPATFPSALAFSIHCKMFVTALSLALPLIHFTYNSFLTDFT